MFLKCMTDYVGEFAPFWTLSNLKKIKNSLAALGRHQQKRSARTQLLNFAVTRELDRIRLHRSKTNSYRENVLY